MEGVEHLGEYLALALSLSQDAADFIKGLQLQDVTAAMVVIFFVSFWFVSHSDSVEEMYNTDVLLYILGHSENPLYHVCARLYEYMASRKPILALVPEGDSENFLKRSGLAFFAEPADPDDISKMIYKLFKKWEKGALNVSVNVSFVEQFEYENLTRELSLVLSNMNGKNSG